MDYKQAGLAPGKANRQFLESKLNGKEARHLGREARNKFAWDKEAHFGNRWESEPLKIKGQGPFGFGSLEPKRSSRKGIHTKEGTRSWRSAPGLELGWFGGFANPNLGMEGNLYRPVFQESDTPHTKMPGRSSRGPLQQKHEKEVCFKRTQTPISFL